MEAARKQPDRGGSKSSSAACTAARAKKPHPPAAARADRQTEGSDLLPLIDDRYSADHIVSHSDMRIASQNVRTSTTSWRKSILTLKSSASTSDSSSIRICPRPATRWRIAASA